MISTMPSVRAASIQTAYDENHFVCAACPIWISPYEGIIGVTR